ncbi:MAG: MBL fold metallo-hydrolase [Clostridia bacterium]|nr:MBL fold metallo-hydrolase [Clostridia bacterium]
MKKIFVTVIMLVLVVNLLSACKDNSKQYFEDDYNNYISNTESSNSTSTDTTISNNSSTVAPIPNTNSSQTSSETSSQIKLQPHELPNYNLNTDYVRDQKQEHRFVKKMSFATKQDYDGYLSSLIKDGFTKYDENKIGDNLFTTLIKKTTFVSISYTPGNKALKIISEPLGDLYPRKSENKYKSQNIQSLFTGMKGENSTASSGLGFIIRLDDGSFIIIDGGGGDYNSVDSNKLMKILRDQSPAGTEKPVIAAWIFTHCHDDHIGVFNAFSKDFHKEVIIESFYYNFPTEEALQIAAKFMFTDKYYGYNQFKDCMNYYQQATTIRPHAGERYYIRNAVIEVLFSYEDLFPDSIENGGAKDLNESSLIFTVEIGGQKMMITGDVDAKGMNFATRNYGNYLKCDILQMSHHGQNGTVEFYSLVNPTYAILPVSYTIPSRFTYNDANRWLVNSKNVRQFIEFGRSNVTFPLPYNPSDADIYDRVPTQNTIYKIYPLH